MARSSWIVSLESSKVEPGDDESFWALPGEAQGGAGVRSAEALCCRPRERPGHEVRPGF